MLEIGSVVGGKYKILNVIGRGGMSVVYLAVNESANKPWAVKEIVKDDFCGFEADRKEIELMKKLRNPHLPGIADVIERRGSLLIVMDYIEGRTLESLLREYGRQEEEDVVDWAVQLCSVLSYLHAQTPPVIYRDMKPSNVMLRPDGRIMLLDLGAAREYSLKNTGDTVALGTRGYAAPEQYMAGEQSDERTDIYCLGAMLFQLLTGEEPHRLQPVRNLCPEISGGLEQVILTCTRTEKRERYSSCAALRYALEHCREQDEECRRKFKRRIRLFCLIFTAALLCGAAAGIFAGMETHVRRSSYEAFLFAAQHAADKEEELENLKKAAVLDPEREEAYLALLRDGFLDDGIFTEEESRFLREILIRCDKGEETNEAVFRRNEKGYAAFSYEAGIAYFYKFEEKSNKRNARGYFESASRSEDLDEKKRKRAQRLYLISSYYAKIGRIDEAGDATVSYRDYWEDLTALSAGDLAAEDNERTALVMYGELTAQIVTRASDFLEDGVTREEMEAQLQNIRQRLAHGFRIRDDAVREEAEKLREAVEQAERILRSACE